MILAGTHSSSAGCFFVRVFRQVEAEIKRQEEEWKEHIAHQVAEYQERKEMKYVPALVVFLSVTTCHDLYVMLLCLCTE